MLVAISIPIFTSQLEKSREATDLANIRDAYAEISTALLTEDMDQSDATCKVLNGLTATTTNVTSGGYTITVENFPIAQTVDEWQSGSHAAASVDVTLGTLPTGSDKTGDLVFTFVIDEGQTYVSAISLGVSA